MDNDLHTVDGLDVAVREDDIVEISSRNRRELSSEPPTPNGSPDRQVLARSNTRVEQRATPGEWSDDQTALRTAFQLPVFTGLYWVEENTSGCTTSNVNLCEKPLTASKSAVHNMGIVFILRVRNLQHKSDDFSVSSCQMQ